ncbi:MAG: hypothetical protein K8S27_03660, partial [Candidatus Omnitrophica bacterium]|nr:hypothetical protein [Candidatus Omnitrophota bacterium]
TRKKEVFATTDDITDVIKDSSNNVASKIKTTYEYMTADSIPIREVVKVVEDPDNHKLTTTTDWYIDPGCNPGSCGKIELRENPDGSWVRYEYDSQGRISVEISSWLDAQKDSIASSARALYYDYNSQHAEDAELPEDVRRPRKITEEILGEVVSATYFVYKVESNGSLTTIVEKAATPTSAYADSGNLRTTTTTYPPSDEFRAWRPHVVTYPDGRREEYVYEKGTYTPTPNQKGTFVYDGFGPDEAIHIYHGTTANPSGIAYKTTRERIVRNNVGEVLEEKEYAFDGGGNQEISWTVHEYDDHGNRAKTTRSNGKQSESVWSCCDAKTETDECGIITDYDYDSLGRVETITKHANPEDIETSYTYDSAGRQESVTKTSDTLTYVTTQNYDSAGRIDDSTDESGLVTD